MDRAEIVAGLAATLMAGEIAHGEAMSIENGNRASRLVSYLDLAEQILEGAEGRARFHAAVAAESATQPQRTAPAGLREAAKRIVFDIEEWRKDPDRLALTIEETLAIKDSLEAALAPSGAAVEVDEEENRWEYQFCRKSFPHYGDAQEHAEECEKPTPAGGGLVETCEMLAMRHHAGHRAKANSFGVCPEAGCAEAKATLAQASPRADAQREVVDIAKRIAKEPVYTKGEWERLVKALTELEKVS